MPFREKVPKKEESIITAFLFLRIHSVQYPSIAGEYVSMFFYPVLAHWAFSSYHEGVYTYYDNFYESDTDHGIRRLSECLYRYGFIELAKWYDYGIYDYNLYPEFDYPIETVNRSLPDHNYIYETKYHFEQRTAHYRESLMHFREIHLSSVSTLAPQTSHWMVFLLKMPVMGTDQAIHLTNWNG